MKQAVTNMLGVLTVLAIGAGTIMALFMMKFPIQTIFYLK